MLTSGEVSGSIPMTFIAGLNSFNAFPQPHNVPAVPKLATKISICPSVSFIISFAVVSSCERGFDGLLNCCGMKESGLFFESSSALSTAPFIPDSAGVSISSAP